MSENLLVVDDDEFFLSLIRYTLETAGFQIETAEDGEIAWDKLASGSSKFDLILLDKHMPRLDGISLLKRIRSDARFVDTPVVMLTGDNNEEDITEGLAAGAYYYLIKPFSENILKQVIHGAMADSRTRRELNDRMSQQAKGLSLLRRAELSCRTLADAKDLALLLAEASMAAGRTLNGYAELLINAVEHGNLGITYAEKSRLLNEGTWEQEVHARLQDPLYSAREVKVRLERNESAYVVTIQDEGNGFDWQSYLEFSPERAFDLHGRGIAMSKALSFDKLEYSGNGNTVVATVAVSGNPDFTSAE